MLHLRALLVLAALVLPAPAVAHDSDAPPGAPHRWLPPEGWVTHRWLPYDEHRLRWLLDVDRRKLFEWLLDDHRTVAELASQRGLDPQLLAEQLVAPRRDAVSPERYQLLLTRAARTLTQGHLARHMFFHHYHQPAVSRHTRELFGVSLHEYRRLLRRRSSPRRIARAGRRGVRELRRALMRQLAIDAQRGVRLGVTSPAQADWSLRVQARSFQSWLDRSHRFRKPLGHATVARRDFVCRL